MLTSSVILDIAIAAVVALTVLLGVRRGLFRSLAELASYVVAYLAASLLAGGLARQAALWLRPLAEERIRAVAGDYLSGVLSEAPGFLTAGLEGLLDLGASEALETVVEQGLYNLAYAIVFAVLFVVALIVLRIAIRAVDTVLKLPLLHQANAIGGGAVGALKGLLAVGLVLWLARRTGLLISPDALEGSYLAALFRQFLPL